MLRLVAVVCLCPLAALLADDAAKPREETMRSDRFADAHAPLFAPPKANDAGALTQKVAGSLPKSGAPLVVQASGFIDRLVLGKMERDHVPHAPLSSDYEFLRRVSLDLTGRIPAPDEVRAF